MALPEAPLPHLERLLARVAAVEAPLIELRGWPGSGRTALLEAFLTLHGPQAWPLPAGILEREDWLRHELAQRAAARWLVAWATPDARLTPALRWLRPGQRLVVVGMPTRHAEPTAAVIGPDELLLSQTEVGALLAREAPTLALRKGAAAAFWTATDGWYRPLRLALASGADGPVSADRLARLPSVVSFLQHEVLGDPAEKALRQLQAASSRRPAPDAPFSARAAWDWFEERGLLLRSTSGDRLPALLSAILEATGHEGSSRGAETAQAAPHRYDLHLLGDPIGWRIENSTQHTLVWTLRRALQVVALLASTAKLEASRAELVEAIWPGEDGVAASRRLHPTLSALRRTLEAHQAIPAPPLLLQGGVYRLNPDFEWIIDVRSFQEQIEAGNQRAEQDEPLRAVEHWQRAWQLYRGAFLQGHYELWIEPRRERYQKLYVDMLRDLGDALARLDRGDEAIDAYRTLIATDPLQERIHLALMRLHARQGRRDLVRRQYERLRTLLLDELGVEPMPATAREYLRLMA